MVSIYADHLFRGAIVFRNILWFYKKIAKNNLHMKYFCNEIIFVNHFYILLCHVPIFQYS